MGLVAAFVEEQGGVAARAAAVAATSRGDVARALADGSVVRSGYGRLTLPSCDLAVATAYGLRGVLCLTSAALWHGWAVKTVPDRPHVLVGRGRRLSPEQQRLAEVHRGALLSEQVRDGVVTDVETTLEQCARQLPEDEGLAVADSALRSGVPPQVLARVSASVRGPGSAKVRRVLGLADDRAANPFESVLRHLALGVPGLHLTPQRVVVGSRQTVRPDLVDEDLRIVVEADSFQWHGGRADLRRDARRYNLLTVDGWLVLRFSWEDVMFDPDHVREVLTAAARMRTQVGRCPGCAA